ncbi:protein-disulfide reductase DsbD family protein [Marinobacteraceae bacterium S3BR75-40.1]
MPTKTKIILTTVAVAVVVVAFILSTQLSGPTSATSNAPQSASSGGLASSASKVDLAVEQAAPEQPDGYLITLRVDDGWHVNANPASMNFLIPTTVTTALDGQPVEIPTIYPQGEDIGIELEGDTIEVYSDGATIRLQPNDPARQQMKGASQLDIQVRVQSCDDTGTCLAPANLVRTVSLSQ